MVQEYKKRILGPVDSAFYYVDTPETPMNIGALTIFEGQIDFDEFVKLVDARIHRAPAYSQRVVQPALNLGQPTWMFDPDFFIGNHIFRVRLDEPGNDEQLRNLAGHLVSGMLDRSKPLWEIHFIEGLQGNRTGVFFKVHHCMVDGLAAVELFLLLLDINPEVSPLPEKPLYDPPPLPSKLGLIAEGVQQDLPYKVDIFKKLGTDLLNLGAVLSDREKRRKTFEGVANILSDNVRPIKRLAINGKNTGKITLAWAEFSLDEVRAIRAKVGASINDVMLTVLASALQKYHSLYGDTNQDFVRVLIPVNVREEEEKGEYGNRISVLPVDIPFEVDSPLERLKATTRYTRVMKDSSLSVSLDILLTLPSLALPVFQPLIWGIAPKAFALLAHTWCTNVAGPPIPVYLMGHRLVSSRGFFPLNPSMGLACVVTSYNQRISMTLVADAGIVPDVQEIAEYLKTSYAALRQAAKVESFDKEPVKEPVPVTAAAPAPETPAPNAAPEEVPAISPEARSLKIQEHTNGTAVGVVVQTAEQATAIADAPAAEAKPATVAQPVEKPRLFSEEWARLFKDAINNSSAYRNASTKWEAGSLAFIMQADAAHGFPAPAAVLMDLHKGRCRSARSLPAVAALQEAAFVIEGDYASWMKVLHGEVAPLAMLVRRKLRLSKGSLLALMPFTQSAQELVRCAQSIS